MVLGGSSAIGCLIGFSSYSWDCERMDYEIYNAGALLYEMGIEVVQNEIIICRRR